MIPIAVIRYMKTAIARMPGLTRVLGSRTMATIVATKGTTTPPRLAPFSKVDIAGISVLVAGGAFGIAICPMGSIYAYLDDMY